MSDLDRLLDFLHGAGYTAAPSRDFLENTSYGNFNEGRQYFRRDEERRYGHGTDKTCATTVEVDTGVGYGGFYASFYFDADGKLLDHGVWE